MTIQTTQKLIKIGSSSGVTIPKRQLDELGAQPGDKLKITAEVVRNTKHDQLIDEYDAFVKQYGQTLKNLADR